jgi:hypothetical protein
MVAVRNYIHGGRIDTAIPTTQNRGLKSLLPQHPGQPDDAGGFPRTTHRDIADADYRTGKFDLPENVMIIQPVAQMNNQAVKQRKSI